MVDFIYIRLIRFPLFNLADCFVTWTAVIVAFLLLFKYKEIDFKTPVQEKDAKKNGGTLDPKDETADSANG